MSRSGARVDAITARGVKIAGRWVEPLKIKLQRRLFAEMQELFGEEIVLFLVPPDRLAKTPSVGLGEDEINARIYILITSNMEKLSEMIQSYAEIRKEEVEEWELWDVYRALRVLLNADPPQAPQSST